MPRKVKNIISLIIIIIIFAVALILGRDLFFAKPTETSAEEDTATTQTASPDQLVINEVVSSSRASYIAADGSAPDWIELYNGSNSSVSLSGLTLSDDEKDPGKYPLPNISIGAGEYLLILCDGSEAEDGFVHASFRLSSDGDRIGIYSGSQEILALDVPALGKDISYGLSDAGTYRYFGTATPGAQNTTASSADAGMSEITDKLISETLVINEYQMDNLNTLMDRDGEHSPWAEVKNIGNENIELAEYALSDNVMNMGKWHFPEKTLAPGESCVVFLSGKNSSDELHADFKLSSDNVNLVLSKDGLGILDVITVDHTMPQNCSRGRDPKTQEWGYFTSPTPAADNLTKSFSRLDVSEDKYLPDV